MEPKFGKLVLVLCFLAAASEAMFHRPPGQQKKKATESIRTKLHALSKQSPKKLRQVLAASRVRRQAAGGDNVTAKERLDNQISFLIHEDIPAKLDAAVSTSEKSIRFSNLKSRSWGLSVWGAVAANILEDVVANNRTFDNVDGTAEPGDVNTFVAAGATSVSNPSLIEEFFFESGLIFGYGFACGSSHILGLPDDRLDCGADDFRDVVSGYGLDNGVAPFFPASDATLAPMLTFRLNEFDLLATTRLSCVLNREDDNVEAAEVAWALEELVTALNLRVEMEG